MFVEQNYYFWKFVHELVAVHGFRVLYIQSEEQEVWLEKEIQWKTHVVRLKQKQINWRNELKRELLVTKQQVKKNRQLFRGGNVVLHVCYVAEHPPVDEWRSVTEEFSDQKSTPNVFFFSDEEKRAERSRFFSAIHSEDSIQEQHPSESEMEAMVPYLKQQVVTSHRKRQQKDQSLFQFGKPIVTYILLAINLLVFFYIEGIGDSTSVQTLIEYGAKYNPAIIDGEWWRILSSMFLHIGTLHLLMNMLALFYLGSAVERIYGSWRFTVVYLLAGVFGGLASFMLNPHVAAGASGAIFGLFGALLFFGVQHKQLFFRTMGWNLLFVIGLNIVFGLLVPQIDNGAHFGGLIGGFVASAFVHLPNEKNRTRQLLALVAYCVAVIAMAWLGVQSTFNENQTIDQVKESQELNQQGDYDEVIQLTTEALEEKGNFEAPLWFNRSYAYIQVGDTKRAKQDLLRVVDQSPDMAEAHYNLAILYQQEGELEKAADHAGTAAELKPKNEGFQKLEEDLTSS